MFDDNQSSQWCERIYNENGRYKYISQALQGQNVLHMLQGSRKSHRHWWLQHRFEKYDNVFGNGTYSIRSIQARATGTVNIPQGAAYKYTPAVTTYFGYGVASTTVDAPTERTAGTEYTATGLPQETGVGNLIYIYNANNIGSIDLSAYISALGSLDISKAVDVNGNSRLTKLVLGDGTNTNSYLDAISGLSNIKSLEEIDIRGYQAITNMDLSTLTNLHTVKASNSGLTSFAPANGVSLTNVVLPSTIQTISLNSANVTSITYTPTTTLREVSLRNVSGAWDIKTFVFDWIDLLNSEQKSLASITLTDINWTGMSASQVLKLSTIGSKTLYGKVTLSSINAEEYQQLIEAFGTSVFDVDGQFVIDAPSSMLLTGPSEIIEGGSGKYIATAFPVTEQQILYKLYNNGTLISTSTDTNGKIYRKYGGVTLYEESGNITVDTGISSDVTLQVRAWTEDGNVFSDFVSIKAKRITYPSAIAINGTGTVYDNGQYSYAKVFSTNDFTAQIININWALS